MLITFVVCLVIGGGILIAGIALGGTWEDATVQIGDFGIGSDPGHGLIVFSDEPDDEAYDAKDLKNELRVDAADVKNLELIFRNCELKILRAEDDKISVEVADQGKDYFTMKLDGDTLKIKDIRKKAASKLKTIEVKLYIPADKVFDEAGFDLGAGDFHIETFAAHEINIDGGAGTISAQKLIASDVLDADMGVGDFCIEDAELGELDIDCGVGSFEIRRCSLKGDADICGGVGDVSIGIIGEKNDFNYELSCGMGSLDVFDDSYSSLGKDKDIDNDAPYTISLECGVGSISVYKAK